jgi:hypothetical protein
MGSDHLAQVILVEHEQVHEPPHDGVDNRREDEDAEQACRQ